MIDSAVSDLPEPGFAGEAQRLAGMEREAHVFEHRAQTLGVRASTERSRDSEDLGFRHRHEKTIRGK